MKKLEVAAVPMYFATMGLEHLHHKRRAARVAQNPKTLKRVEVPPKVTVKFKVGRLMRESLERSEKASQAAQAASQLKDAIRGE